MYVDIFFTLSRHAGSTPATSTKNSSRHRAAFIFGERSRKASLHAFGNLPHKRQSQKLFTSSRGDSRSSLKLRQRLACEDVSFRLRSITLVKRSACAAREVFSLARVRIVFQCMVIYILCIHLYHREITGRLFLLSGCTFLLLRDCSGENL